jgi:preprotein translocase subunit SecE
MVEMGDSAEKKAGPGFFAGVKSEFKKIIWPDKNATVKQSIAVVAISVVVGVIIAILDYVVQHGVFFITNLG